jgi:glycerol-3-phosphate dehydrogenase
MAEETIDRAIKEGFLEKRKCRTKELRISSAEKYEAGDFLRIYDKGESEIKDMISRVPELGKKLHEKLPYTVAEFIWIIRNEMPLSIEDVLARRTRSILLNAQASMEMAPVVAGLMASEMGFDSAWQKEQIESYSKLVRNYLSFT